MTTPASKVEKVLNVGPTLNYDDFKEIIEYLIGRTRRDVKDSDLQKAFEDVLRKC